jgi:hypothetical protein
MPLNGQYNVKRWEMQGLPQSGQARIKIHPNGPYVGMIPAINAGLGRVFWGDSGLRRA